MVFHLNALITQVGNNNNNVSEDTTYNNTGKGDSKMTARQMRKVLRAYLKSCKELYKM